jgi:hypothetical protein
MNIRAMDVMQARLNPHVCTRALLTVPLPAAQADQT